MTSRRVWVPLFLFTCTVTACTKQVNVCKSDSDCSDIAYPFCDVNGEYAPSGGEKGVCTVVPSDCPVDRCGCAPGATTCDQDQLTVCNTDGKSTTTTSCALGCADAKDHCLQFTPSNGLDTPFAGAGSQPDVTLTNGIINTDTGTINGADGPLQTLIVSRAAGNIRVFVAKSFTMNGVTEIRGGLAAAFVAATTITVNGTIDAAAGPDGSPGPGAQVTPGLPCQGTYSTACGGGAGGGNDIAGGAGACETSGDLSATIVTGGAAQVPLTELVGGCYGGGNGANSRGAAPGGALQFVAGESMTIAQTAVISLGGNGGFAPSNGGGSGGNVIIETPVLDVEGGIAANGGGGAGCGVKGSDAHPSTDVASGGFSTVTTNCATGGRGGTATLADSGGRYMFTAVTPAFQDGGGGSVGKARIVTRTGAATVGSMGFISAATTMASLSLH